MNRAAAFGCLLLAGMVSAGAVLAQEDVDCADPSTQAALNICADRDYVAADEALNIAYRATLKRAETTDADVGDMTGAVSALKKGQRGWIAYRDGQCELAGFEARGGSMEPMLVSGCLADLTRKRTEELQAALADR